MFPDMQFSLRALPIADSCICSNPASLPGGQEESKEGGTGSSSSSEYRLQH